jgi:hypothetical protein
MSRSVLVLGAIAFMFLVVATGVSIVIHNFGDNPGPIFVLVILGFVFIKALRIAASAPQGPPASGPSPETDARITRLEQRMTDMQEILLSIDERLVPPTPRVGVDA